MTATHPDHARPRVVLVDVHATDSFREFAAALHRHGVDVVHLRPPYRGRTAMLKRSLDALAAPLTELEQPLESDAPEAVALRRAVLSAPTVDVHAPEPTLAALSLTPEWQANPALAKLRPGLTLAEVADKWDVARLAEAAGVRVPEASLDLRDAALPAVVKGRMGAGGQFVRIVADEPALQAAAADFRGQGVEPFVERFHPHRNGLGTAGVARDGVLLSLGSFERLTSPDEPLRPAVAIRAYHDAQAEAATRRLVEALGYTGIVCLNFVPDDDGSPLLIDVNIRIFGAWVTLDELGVPILDAYLDLIGVHGAAAPRRLDADRWHGVVRVGVGTRGSARSAGRVTADVTRLVWSRRRTLGWGWVASTELRVLQSGASGAVASLRRRAG